MNVFAGLGFVVAAGAVVYFFAKPQPADDYAMPVSAAYAKLSSVRGDPSSPDGAAFGLASQVSGNGENVVYWASAGSMSSFRCELGLTPAQKNPDQTHVTVTCRGGSASDGAAAGIAHNMKRNRVIEMVDATLNGRPYDAYKAKGATASRWPGDGVEGGLGNAMVEAARMSAEVGEYQSQRARERDEPRRDYTPPVGQGIPPRPMLQ